MTLPTLMLRGFIVPQRGDNEGYLKSYTGIEYILQKVTEIPVAKKPGDKVFVIKSGTGSGKSTIIPVALSTKFGKKIALAQPTRTTVDIISRDIVKRNPKMTLGVDIGFHTGVINNESPKGPIIMTTGILLQHMISLDPQQLMKRYSVVIVDEVHRHDTTIDLTLQSIKKFITENWKDPECPIAIVMSATMDPKKYMSYFETTNFVEILGRPNAPVTEVWPKACIANIKSEIKKIVSKTDPALGDVLIFAPSKGLIEDLSVDLKSYKRDLIEMYSELQERGLMKSDQLMFPTPKNGRLVIATNIVETGATFSYLSSVIDTGYAVTVMLHPQANAKMAFTGPLTKASAIQRKGRVGREKPGTWYPLFPKETFDSLDDPYPEVYTTDVSDGLLKMIVKNTESTVNPDTGELVSNEKKTFDITNIGLINSMSTELLQNAVEKLYCLGLIDSDFRPTLSGVIGSNFRMILPECYKMILSSYYHRSDTFATIVMAACITLGQQKLGKFTSKTSSTGNTSKSLFRWEVSDEFIELVLIYETILDIVSDSPTPTSIDRAKKWCIDHGLTFNGWTAVMEMVDDLQNQLLSCGLRPTNSSRIPLIESLQRDKLTAQSEIKKLKKCILEGFRLNVMTFNNVSGMYVTDYRGNSVICKSSLVTLSNGKPLNILTDSIDARIKPNGTISFNTGNYVSILDHFIEIDKRFIY